jgi:homogentisate 1,2-dioxygenase
MMDTFRPLKLTTLAQEIEDEHYPYSWADGGEQKAATDR